MNDCNNETINQPSFRDITHSVPVFSGSQDYDVTKWISRFERICDSVGGNDIFRLKCIRRLMKRNSEAEGFLRIDSSVTYTEFRTNFMANFQNPYILLDIIDKMQKNIYDPKKMTIIGYILKMQ